MWFFFVLAAAWKNPAVSIGRWLDTLAERMRRFTVPSKDDQNIIAIILKVIRNLVLWKPWILGCSCREWLHVITAEYISERLPFNFIKSRVALLKWLVQKRNSRFQIEYLKVSAIIYFYWLNTMEHQLWDLTRPVLKVHNPSKYFF